MKYFISFVFVILLLFVFGCEKEQPMEVDSSVSQSFDQASSNVTLPVNLKPHWRRIMFQGDRRTNGSDNMQGTPANPYGERDNLNFNFSTNSGWDRDITYESSNPYISNYNAMLYTSDETQVGAPMSHYGDLGEAAVDGDTVRIVFMKKSNPYATAVSAIFSFTSLINQWVSTTITGSYASWTSHEFGSVINRNGLDAKGVTFYVNNPNACYFRFDDIRIYSSGHELPPLCRVSGLRLDYNGKMGLYEVSGKVTDWIEEEEPEEFAARFYVMFESPNDGLYYYFGDDYGTVEFGTEDLFFRCGLTDDAEEQLEAGKTFRMLIYVRDIEGDFSDMPYKHINEYDAIDVADGWGP